LDNTQSQYPETDQPAVSLATETMLQSPGTAEAPPGSELPAESQPTGAQWGPIVRELAETIVLTLVIFFLIRTVVQNFRVEGMSMEPSFHDGQFLLINKLAYKLGEPERGDVIVFRYPRDPSRDFIKRVVGLPGETVEIRNGEVYIDGELSPSAALINEAVYNSGPTLLGPDELYVLGDNRPNSSDSHAWGTLPLDLVIGKVILSYWPPKTWGLVKHGIPPEAATSNTGS
jgi:signal peptidase I